ncbi:TPA: 1-deoxy-D-xylulose-5-phosphate reductoisomerase [Candidatus Marinimicrobia bacterium]|nr:MAG: 1-deoxy-D-xylulose 5-phosphate reductoisomerase [Marinimicrobia bacterium 46_47]HAE86677.1 1-deoxy-D-xylulose-5-phosphate reductoisomerase [Candidatus Neomarinimicrobiota bacterium]HBY19199.1 1-deoxy-D-xylulose-5-phosphate reductoisomerase [Candidatus Neomarinimicrobiota bacterium]
MKKIGITGSTGSIGTNALKVIEKNPRDFLVVFLTANRQVEKLAAQARIFKPEVVVIADESRENALRSLLQKEPVRILSGSRAIAQVCRESNCDIILNAIVGSRGMEASVETVRSGKDLALSNKESLVMAGDLINELAQSHHARILPVDSEHSAIWQCLLGEKDKNVKDLILTGSGGPFRERDPETFGSITVKEALKHPNWSMGAKITIDSATMMNKGLEIIEAYHLFHLPPEHIEVLIHPQSIIHSLVRFVDGSVKAQLGVPDMKIPIQFALSWPDRLPADWESLDLAEIGVLTFQRPDDTRFPAIPLALDALRTGGTAPAILNVANEQAVYRFLNEEIPFTAIIPVIEKALEHFPAETAETPEKLISLEKDVTEFVKSLSLIKGVLPQ